MKLFSEEELAHFGILGMKWGRRKAKPHSDPSIKKTAKLENKAKKQTLGAVALANKFIAGDSSFFSFIIS